MKKKPYVPVRFSSNCIIKIVDDEIIISFKIKDEQYYIEPLKFSPVDDVLLGKVMRVDKDEKESFKDAMKFKTMYNNNYGKLGSLYHVGGFCLDGKMGDKQVIGFFLNGFIELFDRDKFISRCEEIADTVKKRTDKLHAKLKKRLCGLISLAK